MITRLSAGTPGQLHYPPPACATAELRDFFQRTATLDLSPPLLARIPQGRVFGPGHILSPDGQSIARDVSLDFGKAPADHWLLGYQKIRQPKPLAGAVAVIATSLGAGYCHWLLEELPRLLALGSSLSDAAALLAHTDEPFAREALALHGWTGAVIEPTRLSHYQCDELVVPSLLGPEGRPTPAVLEALAAFVEPLHRSAAASPWGERLYVSREKARRRRVTNEAALWSALESRGFQRLHLEELSWRDQIVAFRHARVVVAPHGAGLANLAFSPPGARVVEFFNRTYVNPLFGQLAALQRLDYRPVVALSGEPLMQRLAANRDDLAADLPQVLRALE
jgi:capsular polysaccharide biosynthesis protein